MPPMPVDTSRKAARRLINLREVANELDVSIDSVDRFIRAGALPVVRLPSGRRRVAREDLERVIEDWKAASADVGRTRDDDRRCPAQRQAADHSMPRARR
jgi:predicted site-specific integrase-resolvase